MRRKMLEQETVTVPASIIRGFIYSLGEGVKYLQSSLNMARKLNEILDQGGSTNGQRAEVSEGGDTDSNC